jgi:hypothetical protein
MSPALFMEVRDRNSVTTSVTAASENCVDIRKILRPRRLSSIKATELR